MKDEREKNERIIAMQKEQELMKNHNIKEMIRNQKMMAEERKEMVSYKKLNYELILYFKCRSDKRKPFSKEIG